MTSILLTGASGFVGSGVLRYLLEHTDWDFTCVCSWRHHGHPQRVPVDDRVRVVTHDLTGPIPDIGYFDYILHLAAESHVDRSIAEPVAFIENNVSATLSVLEYARLYPPSMLLHFGTDEVYGAADHEEWDLLLPSNPYAASKAASEVIAQAYWRTYGVPVVLTNSNNIAGPGANPEKYLPKLIRLILADKPVEIHTAGSRPGRRHWNPIQNIADALLFILDCVAPTRYVPGVDRPDRFALDGGEDLDNLEMAQLVASLLRRPLLYRLVDAQMVRPGYDEFYPRAEGGLTRMGWKPVVSLRDGLAEWITPATVVDP